MKLKQKFENWLQEKKEFLDNYILLHKGKSKW